MTAPAPTPVPTTPPAVPAPPVPTAPVTDPVTPPTPVASKWDGKVESIADPDVRRAYQEAKAEAVNASAKARENARADAKIELLKQMGLTQDGKEIPDPTKLAAQLASRDAQLKNLLVETAAGRAARTAGADVDALLDSRSFASQLDGLDPAAADFQVQLDALVKTTVDSNPTKFKAARAAGASGLEITGGPGDEGQVTEEQLKTMTPEQIVEAHAKGLMKNLL